AWTPRQSTPSDLAELRIIPRQLFPDIFVDVSASAGRCSCDRPAVWQSVDRRCAELCRHVRNIRVGPPGISAAAMGTDGRGGGSIEIRCGELLDQQLLGRMRRGLGWRAGPGRSSAFVRLLQDARRRASWHWRRATCEYATL